MKKVAGMIFAFLLVVYTNFCSISAIETENLIKFKSVDLNVNSAFAVTENNTLFVWNKTRELQKWADNVEDIEVNEFTEYIKLKNDANVYNINHQVQKLPMYFLKDNQLYRNSKGKSELLLKNVKNFIYNIDNNYPICVVKLLDNTLMFTDFMKDKWYVIDTDVVDYSANLPISKNSSFDSDILYTKHNGSVWYVRCLNDYPDNLHTYLVYKYKIMEEKKLIRVFNAGQVHFFLDKDKNLLKCQLNFDTKEYDSVNVILQDVKNVVFDNTYLGENRYLALKEDGTLWYWGAVIGQPKEHILKDVYTIYASETQDEPVMLSFDPKVNESYVPARMKKMLSDPYARQLVLEQYPEYYLTNYRKHFTEEEIQHMTEKVEEKQKSEADEASQQFEKEQRLSSSAQETSMAAVTATQDKQSDKPKSAATPIIIVILVLLATVGVGIVYKQKKK